MLADAKGKDGIIYAKPELQIPILKLYKLEAIRGLAAFYVVLHHTISEKSVNALSEDLIGLKLGFLFRFGQEAVILFFMLSGFVINYSFTLSRDKTFKTYFLKRTMRIYIPLVIVLATSYLLSSYSQNGLIDPNLKTLVLNLAMLQDWEAVKPNVITPAYMGNTPLWSLSYEWWFYMLYFPLTKIVPNRTCLNYFVFFTAPLATIAYVIEPNFVTRILTYISIWWIGVYLSDLYINGQVNNTKKYVAPMLALLLPNIILALNVHQYYSEGTNELILGLHPLLELRHFMFALLIFVFALIWHRYSWIGFDRIVKPFSFLAPISYTMYIAHHPIMVSANYLDLVNSHIARWILYLMIVLLFSWAVEVKIYNYIKNHIMKGYIFPDTEIAKKRTKA